jgi:hypothetical protein
LLRAYLFVFSVVLYLSPSGFARKSPNYKDYPVVSTFDGIPYSYPNLSRFVVVGDIHSDPDALASIAEATGLIDSNGEWIGGTDVLGLAGDLVGKGPFSRTALDMVIDLKQKAAKVGGRVEVVGGNHDFPSEAEIMDTQHDRLEFYADYLRSDSRDAGATPLFRQIRAKGIALTAPTSPYALDLQSRNLIVRVGNTLLSHTGVADYLLDAPEEHLAFVNTTFRELVKAAQRDLYQAYARTNFDQAQAEKDRQFLYRYRWMHASPEGVMWKRSFGSGRYEVESIAQILPQLKAVRVVSGHVRLKDRQIARLYTNALDPLGLSAFNIDTGISSCHRKPTLSALIISKEGEEQVMNSIVGRATHPYAESLRRKTLDKIRRENGKSLLGCAGDVIRRFFKPDDSI